MNPMAMNGGNMPNGVPGNMAAMNNAANAGTPRTQPDSDTSEYKAKLNTYIYDYLLKNEQYDCARLLLNSSLNVLTKPAGAKKRNDDSMDTDSKDDIDLKKLGDLPLPDRILDANTENSFLLDWFTLFWEIFFAPRVQKPSKVNPVAVQYTNHIRVCCHLIALSRLLTFSRTNRKRGRKLRIISFVNQAWRICSSTM